MKLGFIDKPLKHKIMKKIKSFLPIFMGFYGSLWEDGNEDQDGQYYEEEYGYKGEIDYNYSAYYLALSKAMCPAVADLMDQFIAKVEFEELRSPREYNFYNDAINCIITPKKLAIKKYILTNLTAYQEYLLIYKSRDGFISSYNYDFESWAEYTKNFSDYTGNAHYLGSILNFIAENEGLGHEDLYYHRDLENIHLSEYVKDDFMKTYDLIEKYIQVNYLSPILSTLLNETFGSEEWDLDLIMGKVIGEIEDKNMKITFKKTV